MTRLALFNYLVKANSYNGLIAFSESLEKEKDYLLSDNILKYVKLANQNKLQKQAAQKYKWGSIDIDSKNLFLSTIAKSVDKRNIRYDDIHSMPNAISILANQTNRMNFIKLCVQKLKFNYQMPASTAEKYARARWKQLTEAIVAEIPKFEYLSDFITLSEKILANYNLDADFSGILDPNSYIFKYVFDNRSPAKQDIQNAMKTKFGEEKTRAIIKQISDIIQERKLEGEITKDTLDQSERKFQKLEENRNHGIQNDYEKELLRKSILQTNPGIDISQFMNPDHPDSEKFFDIENYNKFKYNLRDVIRRDKHVFDDEDTYQRLHDSIVIPYWKEKNRYDKSKEQQTQSKKQYSEELNTMMEKEQQQNLEALKSRIQKDLEDKDQKQPDKKWYQFWKQSYKDCQYQILRKGSSHKISAMQ